ncbi:S1C family serine protease [Clostridium estertheticum]|uniref:Trypsin-like serine protease n=1 Tax=Clostridium estertheticum TaxID=238834 RepID=A0A7Y3SUY2_9CLOT|nr:trypsin-like peptidase domain-containing protein [Clostridium estertheticum]NNU75438.1 trypsin-like serine protease [Clostridium estertheticum]WBL47010.1 S1C family serine protease [Clostridium estertheticum]
MNKKIIRSLFAAMIIAGSTYITTFGAMASGTVVIGNQAISLDYANDVANFTEISNDIVSGGLIYVKNFEGNWIDNVTGKTVSASIIPAVAYKGNNKVVNYGAQDKSIDDTTQVAVTAELTAKQIINKYGNAVVYVEVSDKNHNAIASGSGFIVKSTGVIVTNFHVIKGSSYVSVTLQNGTKYDVKSVLNYNEKQDIAVLQLSNATNLSTVTLGVSDNVEVGDNVATIGSPQGYANSLSTGIVSGINRKNERGNDIQTTASITYGSSGGPLFDMLGNVIGITYSGFDSAGNIGFVIPINEVKPFLATSNEKTLSQINSATSNTANFLPLLADVPQPIGLKYDNYVVSSDKDYVEYFYAISNSEYTDYAKLLNSYGWKEYNTVYDDDNNPISYFIKGDNTIGIGWIGANRTILGAIH